MAIREIHDRSGGGDDRTLPGNGLEGPRALGGRRATRAKAGWPGSCRQPEADASRPAAQPARPPVSKESDISSAFEPALRDTSSAETGQDARINQRHFVLSPAITNLGVD